jgi:adenylate cyclase
MVSPISSRIFSLKAQTIKKNTFIVLGGITVSLCVIGSYIFQPYFLIFIDKKIYDTFLRRLEQGAQSNAVAIIDIDEQSLDEFGQWPWPRYRLALLLKKLQDAGALAVGMDVLLAEADRSSPRHVRDNLRKDLGVEIEFQNLPSELEDNDILLSRILAQGPFVLGYFFDFEDNSQSGLERTKTVPLNTLFATEDKSAMDALLQPPTLVPPLPLFDNVAPASGFVNTILDPDGMLRAPALVMKFHDQIHTNLGLATLWLGLGKPPMVLKFNKAGVESLRIGETIVPLDQNGRFSLRFRGKRRSFPYYSAADVINGRVSLQTLGGKFLLVGTSAAGLEDLRATPFDQYYPGVEAQATLIDNILTGDFLRNPDWLPGLQVGLIMVVGFCTTLILIFLGNRAVPPVIAAACGAGWFGGEWVFREYHIFISPLFPSATLILTFVIVAAFKAVHQESEKIFIKNAFSQYVSPALVEKIIEQPQALQLEGEEKNVSLLFADIRRFTALSERLSPTEVTALLHHYLTPVTRTIRNHQGTLDKYIGDAVVAFWNAPVSVEGHQRHALDAALTILELIPVLNKEFSRRFQCSIDVGIGVHTGNVRVGNMGSDDLFDYTVLGDNVNLTARLEGLTKYYQMPLLVSEALGVIPSAGYVRQEIDTVRVVGKQLPTTLYTYRAQREFTEDELTRWEDALALYKEADFSKACPLFERLREQNPRVPLYRIFFNRCTQFLENSPKNWDGAFSHRNK